MDLAEKDRHNGINMMTRYYTNIQNNRDRCVIIVVILKTLVFAVFSKNMSSIEEQNYFFNLVLF